MRITATLACVIVALDCGGKASGHIEQSLFNADWVGAWWIVTAYWTFAAVTIALTGLSRERAPHQT